MTKKYLVSEDKYSGQVVIICEAKEVECRRLLNAEQVKYLYHEPVYEDAGTEMMYNVRAYYHYELGERSDNVLMNEFTNNKERANELFKEAIAVTR